MLNLTELLTETISPVSTVGTTARAVAGA